MNLLLFKLLRQLVDETASSDEAVDALDAVCSRWQTEQLNHHALQQKVADALKLVEDMPCPTMTCDWRRMVSGGKEMLNHVEAIKKALS